MSKPIQYILVDKRIDCHEEIVYLVAEASYQVWWATRDNSAWTAWIGGPFTKIVRRGSGSKILEALAEQEQACYKVWEKEVVQAAAFIPMQKEDMSDALGKLQVAEFNKPTIGWDEMWKVKNHTVLGSHPPLVYVNESLGMSTGKTSAQVAHGVMAWALKQTKEKQESFYYNPVFKIVGLKDKEFKEAMRDAQDIPDESCKVIIRDAGHTEIDPGSATVVVIAD